MKIDPLPPVPGHPGLLALPSDPEQLAIVARLNAGARGVDYKVAHVPKTPFQREMLWRQVNETIAAVQVEPDDGDAMARLSAALNLAEAPAEPEHPAAYQARRIKARNAARHRCLAALAAGYTP